MSEPLARRGPPGGAQGRGGVIDGKWQIDARIGAGGMATVYAATHRNGNRVAIKVLHPNLSREPSLRTRFLREGYVANAVNHPGVVSVLDDGETDDGAVFLVLELLEGETLEARRLRLGGALPLDEALDVADEALDALAAAHEKGIVHRDVKPENVFLTNDGKTKLLDFGLARMKDLQAEATQTGMTIGTPEFMPPEQAAGRRDAVDARSDVWGLGATTFTAITGRFVHHDAQSLHEQLIASATRRAPPIRQLAPEVPPAVAAVIDRALELEMNDRWASAREMQGALRKARSGTAYDSVTMHLGRPPSEKRSIAPLDAATQPAVVAPPQRPNPWDTNLPFDKTQSMPYRPRSPSAPFAQPVTEPYGRPVGEGLPRPPMPSMRTPAMSFSQLPMPEVQPTARPVAPSRRSFHVLALLAVLLFAVCAAMGAYVLARGVPSRR